MIRTNILLSLAIVAGCATSPRALADEEAFASNAVMLEMSVTRSEFSALRPDEQSQVYIWLNSNCAVGASERRAELVKTGSRAELTFIEAYRMGPPDAFLAELVDARRSNLAAIQEQLAGEDRELFDEELAGRVKALSEKSYVNDGVTQVILSYRLAALDGIGSVGSNTSIAWLEQTIPKVESKELRSAAERALAALRKRMGVAKS